MRTADDVRGGRCHGDLTYCCGDIAGFPVGLDLWGGGLTDDGLMVLYETRGVN